MNILTRILAIVAVCVIVVTLVGCNTTKGVGTDIEKAGEGLKNSADRNGAQ